MRFTYSIIIVIRVLIVWYVSTTDTRRHIHHWGRPCQGFCPCGRVWKPSTPIEWRFRPCQKYTSFADTLPAWVNPAMATLLTQLAPDSINCATLWQSRDSDMLQQRRVCQATCRCLCSGGAEIAGFESARGGVKSLNPDTLSQRTKYYIYLVNLHQTSNIVVATCSPRYVKNSFGLDYPMFCIL